MKRARDKHPRGPLKPWGGEGLATRDVTALACVCWGDGESGLRSPHDTTRPLIPRSLTGASGNLAGGPSGLPNGATDHRSVIGSAEAVPRASQVRPPELHVTCGHLLGQVPGLVAACPRRACHVARVASQATFHTFLAFPPASASSPGDLPPRTGLPASTGGRRRPLLVPARQHRHPLGPSSSTLAPLSPRALAGRRRRVASPRARTHDRALQGPSGMGGVRRSRERRGAREKRGSVHTGRRDRCRRRGGGPVHDAAAG